LKTHFKLIVKTTLISVYVIFLAGSVVRMTGSGMGCPDWPKCFGYLIPPTSEEQITWKPKTQYAKGSIIVADESLYLAQKDLKTGLEFDQNQWEKYSKHDYAVFNVYHTWTEYVNRLTSAISGIFFLIMVIASLKFWKKNKQTTLLAFFGLFLMIFEAWLGKTVVDSVLKPSIITVHMVTGLVIIAVLIKILHSHTPTNKEGKKYNKGFHTLLLISAIFSLIQIALGTQVRQFVDEQIKIFGFENKQMSLYNPNLKFYIHRSFTIAIILINLAIFYKNEILRLKFDLPKWILGLLTLEAITGMLMFYSDFPLGTQAVHLLSGALLFGVQFYLILQNRQLKD